MNQLLAPYRAFAIDLDGVVWRGSEFIPGSIEALRMLQALGRPLLLLTNNAGYQPSYVVERLADGGVEFTEAQVLNTCVVAARWIERNSLTGVKAMILGPPSVLAQLEPWVESVDVVRRSGAQMVIVARDVTFDFARLDAASAAVREGAILLSMNRDTVLPMEDELQPGTGSILAAIEAASGQLATVLGKPELPMMEAAKEILGEEKTLMIGDRMESDVAGAHRIGWDAALVLTGVSAGGRQTEGGPEILAASLAELVRSGG